MPSVDTAPAWWTVRDSNPRPPRCERGALPTELRARRSERCSCARPWDEAAGLMSPAPAPVVSVSDGSPPKAPRGAVACRPGRRPSRAVLRPTVETRSVPARPRRAGLLPPVRVPLSYPVDGPGPRLFRCGCRGRIRTCDLRVMSPTRWATSPPCDECRRREPATVDVVAGAGFEPATFGL